MQDFLKWTVYGGLFLVPFLVLLVTGSLFFPYITGKNFAFRIIVEVVFAAWVLLALYAPQYRPKFSWVLGAFGGLVVVMFFANLFGEYPLKSFMSNFERMDGYVTLAHVFVYFLVLGSMLTTEKLWNWFFGTTLVIATLTSLYAFGQYFGSVAVSQGGGWRLDGTLGNSTYMAIYMFFHIAIAALMALRVKTRGWRIALLTLAAVFVFILLQTGTRGTTLALAGAFLLAGGYIALFWKGTPWVRTGAIGVIAVLLAIGGALVAFKDASVVAENPLLSRIANISLEEGETRFTIWSVALEGVKERPILGWGQGNFDYVFNQHFDPELLGQEAWFDRVHNIVLDWLIAGGVVGAVFYFSIIAATLFYVLILRRHSFSIAERGILLGLLGGYVFHNLFVFDNLISYIFFAAVLAFVHQRVAGEMPALAGWKMDDEHISKVVAPVVCVVLIGVVYIVNVPGILTAKGIIDTARAGDPEARLAVFQKTIAHDSFANREVRERLVLAAVEVLSNENINESVKQAWYSYAREQMEKQNAEKPGDARQYFFLAALEGAAGNIEERRAALAAARELSPDKQMIIFEQGYAALAASDAEAGHAFFKEAYELAPEKDEARVQYAIASLLTLRPLAVETLIDTDARMRKFSSNNRAVQAAYRLKMFDLLKEMLTVRIEVEPNEVAHRVNLATVYHETGDTDRAIEIIEEAIADIPSFAEQGEQIISTLESERV